jgi:opacity protein-like surface antigen
MLRLLLPAMLTVAFAAAGCRQGPDIGQRWPDPDRKVMLSARASCDIGQAKHVEESNLSALNSDWESVVYRPRISVGLRTRAGLEFSAEFSGIFTDDDREEEWKLDGEKVSENDLGIDGHEFRLLGGWGADVQHFGRITLLGGFTGRSLKLERDFEGRDSTEVDADMYFWELEGRLALPIKRGAMKLPITLEASVSYGRAIDPEADIDGVGTISGNHVWLLRARAGLDFQINERVSLYLGGFYEDMEVDGGTRDDTYEWADSESITGGGEVGVRVKF